MCLICTDVWSSSFDLSVFFFCLIRESKYVDIHRNARLVVIQWLFTDQDIKDNLHKNVSSSVFILYSVNQIHLQ